SRRNRLHFPFSILHFSFVIACPTRWRAMASDKRKTENGNTTWMATAFGVRELGILLANSAKLFSAPEGRRKLAGGEAKRNHRDRSKKIVRVPAGTPDQNSQQDQSLSGALSGRVVPSRHFRRLRFAPAPANIPRASGAVGVRQRYPERPHSKVSADLCAVF